MILYADSGSTKTEWIGVDGHEIIFRYKTEGINPQLMTSNEIMDRLMAFKHSATFSDAVLEVNYFGAGCSSVNACSTLKKCISEAFPTAKTIHVDEDMAAAVYGSTDKAGVVCILGTGSNACYYDGEVIHKKASALGYCFMDEGSGNWIGKELLRNYYYKKMPQEVVRIFESTFELSDHKVLKSIYSTDNPSKFLASFARFAIEHATMPFIRKILNQWVLSVFEYLLHPYKEELTDGRPLYFVGSIAYYLQEMIAEQAGERGFKVNGYVREPLENLIKRNSMTNLKN